MASSSSMSTPSEEDLALMKKLMSDGKRNYICNQPQLALECFVELCEKLATFYGQESDKCVEAYLYYGKTLLEIGRLENGVLGHAIKEAPVFGTADEASEETELANEDDTAEDEEDMTPEKRIELRNHVEHAMRDENLYNVSSTDDDQTEEEDDKEVDTEGKDADEDKKSGEGEDVKSSKDEDATKSTDKDVTSEDISTTATTTEASSTDTATTTTTTEASSADTPTTTATGAAEPAGDMEVDDGIHSDGSDIGDEDGEEDVSNMELSWEMFELTTVICKRQLEEKDQDIKKVKSVLAEAKYGLAQVSLETERYEEAVKDFTECLKLYKEILDDGNDRRIAEAHYNIALAYSFDKKFSEAIEQFECAVKILKSRVEDLEGKVKKCEDEGSKTDKAPVELEEWKKEIVELNDLIVLDMMAKIEDAHESKKLLEESIEKVKNAAGEILGAFSSKKNEFDAGFDEGFDAPLQVDNQVVHDISDKIRSSKRKIDDDSSTVVEKKIKSISDCNTNLDPVSEE